MDLGTSPWGRKFWLPVPLGRLLEDTHVIHTPCILKLQVYSGAVSVLVVLHVVGGILALCAHCALLLDYVPPEDPLGTPLGNNLRIWRPKLDWRGP